MATTFKKEVKIDKSAIPATEFIKDREKLPKGLQTLLLHTRYKTKGDPEVSGNNHPVIYKTCFAIHNGSISNDDDLFKSEELQRNFEVDTEIIAALFDKYGMEDEVGLKLSLEKLQGAMATAVIDPVNYPGKLLLAKGSTTPLAILNTKDFIVWASTTVAIREAWAKVFGTPPDHDKIKHLTEGKAWLVEGAEIEEFDFKVNRPLWQGGWRDYRPDPRKNAQAAGRSKSVRPLSAMRGSHGLDSTKPWSGHNSLFITERAFKDAVEKFRGAAIGRTARIWSERELYDSADFADVTGMHEWLPCLCGESILRQDMKFHLKYKGLCMDCQEVVTLVYRDKARRDWDKDDMPRISGEDLHTALTWGDIDSRAHAMIVDTLVEESSLTIATIEYFLYRSPQSEPATPYAEVTRTLKSWLQKRYKALENEVWEKHHAELLADEEQEDKDTRAEYSAFQTITNGVKHLWYRCSKHDITFKHGETCQSCEGTDILVGRRVPRYACSECGETFPRYQVTTTDLGIHICDDCLQGTEDSCQVHPLRALPAGAAPPVDDKFKGEAFGRCPTCKTWQPSANMADCHVCQVAKNAITVTATCCGKTQKNKPCKRKVRFVIAGIGFCYNHWNHCHYKKCNEKAKHMNDEGVRYCHDHVRRTSGFRADTQWVRDGATIVEVV